LNFAQDSIQIILVGNDATGGTRVGSRNGAIVDVLQIPPLKWDVVFSVGRGRFES
jgi:hypothetical protein